MSVPTIDELRAFHQFLGAKLHDDSTPWTPEEALDEWRRQHPDAQAIAEDLAAIEEALADVARGDRGIPFDEFDRDFLSPQDTPGSIFLSSDAEVLLLRVRGPGQPPLKGRDV